METFTLYSKYVLFISLLLATTTAAPFQNVTLPLPAGLSDHGTPGLLCRPTKWFDIIVFFLGNYVAHAATTRSIPGERTAQFIFTTFGAFLFPASGAFRAISSILTLAKFGKTDLEIAARAGALCMVVRGKDWKPQAGDIINNAIHQPVRHDLESDRDINDSENKSADTISIDSQDKNQATKRKVVQLRVYEGPWAEAHRHSNTFHTLYARKVHGSFNLPPGYRLRLVPKNAKFIDNDEEAKFNFSGTTSIACNYNSIKILIALAQSIYSITTLYNSRGSQINQFGYASFGLTVTPYAVISVLNLIGSLVCPEYPSFYLVGSSVMQEVLRRGEEYKFSGVLGTLDEDTMEGDGAIRNITSADETPRWCGNPIKFGSDPSGNLTVEIVARQDLINASCDEKTDLSSSQTADTRLMDPPISEIFIVDTTKEEKDISSTDTIFIPTGNPTKDVNIKRLTDLYRIQKTFPVAADKPSCLWRISMEHNPESKSEDESAILAFLLCIVVNFIPIIIIGVLSQFRNGNSTAVERGWIMAWLSWGILFGSTFFGYF